jgi:hypothetical protein
MINFKNALPPSMALVEIPYKTNERNVKKNLQPCLPRLSNSSEPSFAVNFINSRKCNKKGLKFFSSGV